MHTLIWHQQVVGMLSAGRRVLLLRLPMAQPYCRRSNKNTSRSVTSRHARLDAKDGCVDASVVVWAH
ncbi:unnamed protein product [Urochloa humidicola]